MKLHSLLLLWLFAITILIASPKVLSAEEDLVPCGMEQTSEGLRIKKYDSSICPEDLAFQGTYLIFAEIFQDPAVRPFVLWFIDEETLDSPFTQYADEVIGSSGVFHLLFSSVAILVWALSGFLITGKLIKYVSMVIKTGHVAFKESEQGDTVLFVSYLSFLLIMMVPLGTSGGRDSDRAPVMLGQALVALGSIPSNMGGNFLYSTHLSFTETASSTIPQNEMMLLPAGQSFSNNLIEGQLCQASTRQAIMNLNAQAGATFFKSLAAARLFNYDQNTVSEKFNECLSYVGNAKDGTLDDTIKEFAISKYTENDGSICSVSTGRSYNSAAYGSAHNCLKVQYDFGDNKFEDLEELVDGDSDASESLLETFSAAKVYPLFRSAVASQVRVALNNETLTPDERYEKLYDIFSDAANSVIGQKLRFQQSLKTGSNDEKQARHLAVTAIMMGGTIERGFFADFWDNGTSSFWNNTRKYLPLEPEDSPIFGVDAILEDATLAADYIRQHYCAMNWADQSSARRFILDYNTAPDNENAEQIFASNEVKLQCVRIKNSDDYTSDDRDRYIEYMVNRDESFYDYGKKGSEWIRRTDSSLLEQADVAMKTVFAPEILKKYQEKQFIIAGYSMAVKKAVADNLRLQLSAAETEASKDIELRPRGWAFLGGSFLYSGQQQSSAMHMGKSIDEVVTAQSNGTDSSYIERTAFGDRITVDQEETINRLFGRYKGELYFTSGSLSASTYSGPSGIDAGESDEAMAKQLLKMVEGLLLGPMDHIKAASGMPADKTLSAGLQMCFDGGYENCLSGAKHPVVAMSNFGNDMIDNMITAIIAQKITKLAVDAMKDDGKGDVTQDADKKKTWLDDTKSFIKKATKKLVKVVGFAVVVIIEIIMALIQVANLVLTTLLPLFYALLLVGVVFAYIIPMMSYLFGFMVMILFLVGLFVQCVTMPIYLLMKLWTIEKEYQNGFKVLYQDFMGVYSTPIFFCVSGVVSWTMITIIMYAINVSFSILNHGLTSNSSLGLSSLVFMVFLYIVYFVVIFILFRFGLGIMKDMPDQLKEKANMKKSNDDQYIQSLGFEQYIQAQITKSFISMPKEMGAAISNYKNNGGFNTMKELRQHVSDAEDAVKELNLSGLSKADAMQRGADNAKSVLASKSSATPNPVSNGSQNNGPQNDGTQNDGTQNDGTQNDGSQNDGTQRRGSGPQAGSGDSGNSASSGTSDGSTGGGADG